MASGGGDWKDMYNAAERGDARDQLQRDVRIEEVEVDRGPHQPSSPAAAIRRRILSARNPIFFSSAGRGSSKRGMEPIIVLIEMVRQ